MSRLFKNLSKDFSEWPRPFFVAGPCVIESEDLCLRVADRLAHLAQRQDLLVIFKASYDKANRTSLSAFRGIGKQKGLEILRKVKKKTGLPVLTDIHVPGDAAEVAEVVDVLQIPAFLCRQTDLLLNAAKTELPINVKKGQFMSPADMRFVVEKIGSRCLLTERGTFFGYNRLVVDFPGLQEMKALGAPVIFDATHSVQAPGGLGGASGGNRDMAIPMALAAICHCVDGLFFEVHPDPDNALCDGPNSLRLLEFENFVPRFLDLKAMLSEWKDEDEED